MRYHGAQLAASSENDSLLFRHPEVRLAKSALAYQRILIQLPTAAMCMDISFTTTKSLWVAAFSKYAGPSTSGDSAIDLTV